MFCAVNKFSKAERRKNRLFRLLQNPVFKNESAVSKIQEC